MSAVLGSGVLRILVACVDSTGDRFRESRRPLMRVDKPLRLNLGACDRRFPGFLSVDICEPADVIADLAGPWPWEDSSVDEVFAHDVFEHIGPCDHVSRWMCSRCVAKRCGRVTGLGHVLVPDPLPLPMRHWSAKAHVMNELWRVLKPGGKATLQIPHATLGDGGHCDPTHQSYWTTSDFEYYTPGIAERERFRNSSYYGIKADFRIANLTKPGSKFCLQCSNSMANPLAGCVGGHIPTVRYPRTFGGYVVEMQIVLECVK